MHSTVLHICVMKKVCIEILSKELKPLVYKIKLYTIKLLLYFSKRGI